MIESAPRSADSAPAERCHGKRAEWFRRAGQLGTGREGRDRHRRGRRRRRHREWPGLRDPPRARRDAGRRGRPRRRAGEADGRDDRGGRRRSARVPGRRHARLRLRGHGRGGARPLRPSRLPRQQRRDRQPGIRRRRERGALAAADDGQRRQHVPGGQARDPGHAPSRRWSHRQRVVDLRSEAPRAHRLLRLQGRCHRADAGDGRRSRTRGHPGELRCAGPRLHAHGLPARHERRRARPAAQGVGARDRRDRVGHRPRRAVLALGLRALHHRPHARGGRRHNAVGAGTRRRGLRRPGALHAVQGA
jgi:hypothetical protein